MTILTTMPAMAIMGTTMIIMGMDMGIMVTCTPRPTIRAMAVPWARRR